MVGKGRKALKECFTIRDYGLPPCAQVSELTLDFPLGTYRAILNAIALPHNFKVSLSMVDYFIHLKFFISNS